MIFWFLWFCDFDWQKLRTFGKRQLMQLFRMKHFRTFALRHLRDLKWGCGLIQLRRFGHVWAPLKGSQMSSSSFSSFCVFRWTLFPFFPKSNHSRLSSLQHRNDVFFYDEAFPLAASSRARINNISLLYIFSIQLKKIKRNKIKWKKVNKEIETHRNWLSAGWSGALLWTGH